MFILIILIFAAIISLAMMIMDILDNERTVILDIILFIVFIFGIVICYNLPKDKPKYVQKPTDYQIICDKETLIIMDSSVVVKKIPYSDTSDIWKVIIEDNR